MFGANVNPLGLSGQVKKNLAEHLDIISSYPDRDYTDLKKAIAAYTNTSPEHIVVGNGSTELISLLISQRAPKRALLLGPTYSEYARELNLVGGTLEYYNLKEEQDLFLYYDASLNQLKVLTKREMQGVGPAQAQLSFDKMNEYIDKNIHEGMKVIRLTWDNNGTPINTLCIVSDLKGLVYDCFLSNILLFNVEGKTVERVESVL